MKVADLDILRCPHCQGRLEVAGGKIWGDELPEGRLRCLRCSRTFPVSRSIPRFCPTRRETSYDIGFAEYQNIQLDSVNGTDVAGSRIEQLRPLSGPDRKSRLLLEVGCGSGRYTEHILNDDADLWAVDLSAGALEACRSNLHCSKRLHLAQGDIYRLPFASGAFDVVYALGVLMAVRSPLQALQSLQRHLKPRGLLIVDIYRWRFRHLLNPRTWLRPFTSRLPVRWLWKMCDWMVPLLWPVSRLLGSIPRYGRHLRSLVPISNYDGVLPLNEKAQKQFSLLDTFDALAATYSHCVTERRLRGWLGMAGLSEIEIFPGGMMAARARKAAAPGRLSPGSNPPPLRTEGGYGRSSASGYQPA